METTLLTAVALLGAAAFALLLGTVATLTMGVGSWTLVWETLKEEF